MMQVLTDQIQFCFDWTNELNESISSYLKPINSVVYLPSQALARALSLSETTALLYLTYTIGFLLSLGFNFVTLPTYRKLYTVLTSFFLGFYMHGLGGYFI